MLFLFRNQPWNALATGCAIVYFLCALPVWVLVNALPSMRPRRSWSLRRTLSVRSFRFIIDFWYWTALPPNPPLESFEKDAQSLGFVWVPPVSPDLVVGEIKEFAELNGVASERVGGFWIGGRGLNGEFGQHVRAEDKVVYHIHGGGYIVSPNLPLPSAH